MQNKWFHGCALTVALFFLISSTANAVDPLSVSVQNTLSVDMGLRQTLALRSSPSSAALGIDCGMADMCGIDPCTCGSPDTWGHCACNGTKQTAVSYTLAVSDPKVTKASVKDGRLVVQGLSAGRATITVTGKLKHYADAVQTVSVTVRPPYYLLWILPPAAAAFAVIVLLRRRRKRRMKKEATSP